jgi:putative addiction module component (TIGR02574 family)
MANAIDRVLEEALKLAPEERARIVSELLASLEPDTPGDQRTEADWIQELERRARAAMAGSPGVSWTTARDQIQTRLSGR